VAALRFGGLYLFVLVLARSSLPVGPLCSGKQNPKSFFLYVFWFVGYVVPLVVVAGHRALLSVLCAIVVVACVLISLRLASEIFLGCCYL
jgi:Flp pilus assembly protein TadB